MNQLNNVLLEGYVLGEPRELAKAGPEEKWGRFVKFDMVSRRIFRNRKEDLVEEKLYIGVQCWGEVADSVMGRVDKAWTVRVVGRLKLNEWTGRDGARHRDMEIVANHVEFRPPYRKGENLRPQQEVIALDGGGLQERTGEPEFIYTYD